MLKFLKVSVSAIALSAFVVAPIMTVATADYAYAKNGNGNGGNGNGGNGKGGGEGNGGKGGGNGNGADKGGSKGKSADKGVTRGKKDKSSNSRSASKGKSNGKSNKGVGRALKDDFKSFSKNIKQNGIGSLFRSKDKQRTVKRAAYTKTAPVKSARPPARVSKFDDKFDKGTLHPSNLGKLNGAINSSPNAKAAHIANGQYMKGTGPVSLAAALAVADYDYANAFDDYREDLAKAEETLNTVAALEEANAIVEAGPPTQMEVVDAQAVIDDPESTPKQIEEAQAVIDEAADAAQALEDAQAVLDDPDSTQEQIDEANKTIDAAKEIADAQEFIEDTETPTQEAIDEANAIIEEGAPSDEDVVAAEDALLAAYKGSFSDDEILAEEEQQEVIDAVRGANPSRETIEEALDRPEEIEEDVLADENDVLEEQESAEQAEAEEEIIAGQG